MACCTLIFFLCAFYNVSTILLRPPALFGEFAQKKGWLWSHFELFWWDSYPSNHCRRYFYWYFLQKYQFSSKLFILFYFILFLSLSYYHLELWNHVSTQFYGFVHKNQISALGHHDRMTPWHHDRIRLDFEVLECHASFIFHGWFYLIFIPLIIAFRSILLAYLSTSASIPTFILLLGKFNTFV